LVLEHENCCFVLLKCLLLHVGNRVYVMLNLILFNIFKIPIYLRFIFQFCLKQTKKIIIFNENVFYVFHTFDFGGCP
jgi:hypothetical protein